MVDQGSSDPAGPDAPRSVPGAAAPAGPWGRPPPPTTPPAGGSPGAGPSSLPPPSWASGASASSAATGQPWGAAVAGDTGATAAAPARPWGEARAVDAGTTVPSAQPSWGNDPGSAASAGGAAGTPQTSATLGQPIYPPPIRPVYDGTLGGLYLIYLKNLVLALLTLGLYRFWGRTRLRRYLWSHTSVFGDRFEYRGTGLEMFFGFLTGLGLLLLIAGIGVGLYEWSGEDNPLSEVGLDDTLSWGFIILGVPLLYVAQYGSLRYRLTRTSWRGIHGRLEGSAWRFGALYTGLTIANLLSAYLLLPVLQTQSARYQLRNARLGTAPVEFAGTPGDIYGRYIGYYFLNIAAWVGVSIVVAFAIGAYFSEQIPSLEKFLEQLGQLELKAILLIALALLLGYLVFSIMILPVRCWYEAFLLRYLVSRTRLSGMLFVTAVGTRQMWGYLVLNYLIILLTIGIGFPWVLHRTMRLITDQLWIYGAPDARLIQQKTDDGSAAGEGLLDLLSPGAV